LIKFRKIGSFIYQVLCPCIIKTHALSVFFNKKQLQYNLLLNVKELDMVAVLHGSPAAPVMRLFERR
jgi:hypothetical protein